MLLSIQNVALGNIFKAVFHKHFFHRVLNVLHAWKFVFKLLRKFEFGQLCELARVSHIALAQRHHRLDDCVFDF